MDKKENGSNFYLLTAQVLNDPNLISSEKICMSILYGLSDEEGKCFPSNAWLAKKLLMSERGIQKILENLEKNNYIFRQIVTHQNNPMKKYRIIYVTNNLKFNLDNTKKINRDELECASEDELECAHDTNSSSCIIDKKDIIEEEEGPSALPPPKKSSRKKIVEEKVELAPFVFLTQSQQDFLKKRIEPLGITCEDCYTKLSNWKIGKQIQGGSSDYLTICSWVIDAVQKDKINPSKSPSNDLELIKRLQSRVDLVSRGIVNLGADYVEFPKIRDAFFKVGERGFKEKVLNSLRKAGVSIID